MSSVDRRAGSNRTSYVLPGTGNTVGERESKGASFHLKFEAPGICPQEGGHEREQGGGTDGRAGYEGGSDGQLMNDSHRYTRKNDT